MTAPISGKTIFGLLGYSKNTFMVGHSIHTWFVGEPPNLNKAFVSNEKVLS